ncbi:hypothetical protein C1645_773467 [Glomus cerebriforme]|uniref:Uncharacterized protein n=1 Tax=Glomus cerebriforme TaxID=658196 RepID=A0A397T1U0_9GLOM|nr:hypothetical protein C1645_773467 [Glomus cerebriforme]
MLKQIFTSLISISTYIFTIFIILTCLLFPVKAQSVEDTIIAWSESKNARTFFLRVLPIIGQHLLLREYLDDEITLRMRLFKDMVQTFLPPLVALVAFFISPAYTEPKYRIPIHCFFLLNLISACVTFRLSVDDFEKHKDNDEVSYPKYKIFMRICACFNILSGGLFLYSLYIKYGLRSENFIIYSSSLGVILIGSILSLFKRNVNSLGYTIRTLFIGIISYYTTTDHWEMNEVSITISLVAASLTLSFAISDLHKLEESFIFKLDHLKENKKPRHYIPYNVVHLEEERIKLVKENQELYKKLLRYEGKLY